MAYKIVNLIDIYNNIGIDETNELLKTYKCELNKDVEYFLQQQAIPFSKQDISRTFLVVTTYQQENVIVGYFAISNKTTIIKKEMFKSQTKKKRIAKYAKYNEENKGYILALPLIGQLGKNYNNGYNELISGDVLLKLALNKIKEIQNNIGRKICVFRMRR